MANKNKVYRYLVALGRVLLAIGLLFAVLLAINFLFIWPVKTSIVIVALGIVMYVFANKEGERYFLVIAAPSSEAVPLFWGWLNKQGFRALDNYDIKNLKWLKTKPRDECRVYNFYDVSGAHTVISENILQKEISRRINLFFHDEVRSLSELFNLPVYYIAQEHSLDMFAIYRKGQEEKRLSFETHGTDIGEFKEQGKDVEKEEIKQRGYSSYDDYIDSLNLPLGIDKGNIRKIIKGCRRERIAFGK